MRRLFRVLDADGSGKVDAFELSIGATVLCRGSPQQKTRCAFQLFDQDGDGPCRGRAHSPDPG